MPTPQEYIKQAEKWGKQRQSKEGLMRAMQWGWQAGMQMRQMKAQDAGLEQEQKKEALNAQFNVFELRKPYMTLEQIDQETKSLLNTVGEVYGIPIDTSSMEFKGQENKVAAEALKIGKDLQSGKITSLVQLNEVWNMFRQKHPRQKLDAIKAAQGRSKEALQALQTTEQQKTKLLMDLDRQNFRVLGPTPEGTPQGVGLLPPSGAAIARSEAPQGTRRPSGISDIGGYQVQKRPPKPQKYVPTTEEAALRLRRAGATQISIGEKTKQKAEAEIRHDPGWKDSVIKYLKSKDPEWQYGTDREQKLSIRTEADRRIREIWPNAVFDSKKGVLGWYDNGKLIRRWVD